MYVIGNIIVYLVYLLMNVFTFLMEFTLSPILEQTHKHRVSV